MSQEIWQPFAIVTPEYSVDIFCRRDWTVAKTQWFQMHACHDALLELPRSFSRRPIRHEGIAWVLPVFSPPPFTNTLRPMSLRTFFRVENMSLGSVRLSDRRSLQQPKFERMPAERRPRENQ